MCKEDQNYTYLSIASFKPLSFYFQRKNLTNIIFSSFYIIMLHKKIKLFYQILYSQVIRSSV